VEVYRRNGTWCISYVVNGKDIRKAIGTVKKNAEATFENIKVDIRAGRYRAKEYPKLTMEELAKRFMEWAKIHRKGNDYKTHVPVIEEYFKKRLISTITEGKVESFRKQRMDTPTTFKTKRKKSTLNGEFATLSRMFSLAVKWELTDCNPAAK
jgi:hypothetical protein